MDVKIQYKSTLLVDGAFMQLTGECAVTPERFHEVLNVSRAAIQQTIESNFAAQTKRNPGLEIQRGGIWVARASSEPRDALSDVGIDLYENAGQRQANFTEATQVKPNILPYWHAIEDLGFLATGSQVSLGEDMTGLCLMARTEPYRRVSE